MRRLVLAIDEPLPGQVLPAMAAKHGEVEAARRYRAIVVTTLRQLRGLSDTRIQVLPSPTDAEEAIRFWLLPRLADHWKPDAHVYHNEGWQISFCDDSSIYQIHSTASVLCPYLSARWVHTAMLGLEAGTHHAIGHATHEGLYFHARAMIAGNDSIERLLPKLPIIHTDDDWIAALQSPLGPALKRAWEEEA